jgi:hypothetical protein
MRLRTVYRTPHSQVLQVVALVTPIRIFGPRVDARAEDLGRGLGS